MKKGKLICFEGGEGSGKSTMVKNTYEYLKNKGIDCVIFKEPGGTEVGEDIRNILLSKEYSSSLDEQTKLYLLEAGRRENYLHIIKPALEAGKVILADRFVLSSLVLQNKSLGTNVIDDLNNYATDCIDIDATIILDIDPQTAINRIVLNNRETNYNDVQPLEWHTNIRNLLIYLGMAMPKFKSHMVDANRNEDEVFKDVINLIEEVINKDE